MEIKDKCCTLSLSMICNYPKGQGYFMSEQDKQAKPKRKAGINGCSGGSRALPEVIEYLPNQVTPMDMASAALAGIKRALQSQGIDDSYMARKWKNLLEAVEVKRFAKDGEIVTEVQDPDLDIQLSAAREVSGILGHRVERSVHDIRRQTLIVISNIPRPGDDEPA